MFKTDLVTKCKANNRKAQMQLYNQYCNGMFIVAMRFVNNQDDAEDLVQEAFITAFQKIEQFKAELSFGAWLKKIVINKCLDFIKKKSLNTVAIDENEALTEETDWKVDNDVTINVVKEKLSELPFIYQSVLQLFLFEGYDHAEISGILNITETACRTRLLRGKNKLKELLKDLSYVNRY